MWLAAGPKNLLVKDAGKFDVFLDLYIVKFEFEYSMKRYCMEYHFETANDGKMADWTKAVHDLQQTFGMKEFLMIAPQSASGVILDPPEASKLLSAVAIALSNCSCRWPAFVPVHDPSRKAYIGIQNKDTVFTRRFEADRICSQVPIKLMHLEGLYELFVSKFAYAAMDLSFHHFRIQFKMKLTYRTPIHDDEDEVNEADGIIESVAKDRFVDSNGKVQWDDDCPWSEWYSAEDPVKGFELLAIWHGLTAESSLYMAELENASPLEADDWFLCPLLSSELTAADGKTIGFSSQLLLLIKAFKMSLEAKFIEDFVSVETLSPENLNSSAVIPPPTVLDRVLKDIFHEETQVGSCVSEHKSSQAIKGAPVDSLFGIFCLHALWFGNCNIRAIAVLWIEFVREVRWYWEESQQLPRMPPSGTIDLSTCLINQKLHMLAICINIKCHKFGALGDDSNHALAVSHRMETPIRNEELASNVDAEGFSLNTDRKGSAGVAGSLMLLKSHKRMHAPITQDPPAMTEDMHEERHQAVAALGDSFSFSAQLETDILFSDMSSFKAANPDAVFEDFIRWYSPKDWVDDDRVDDDSAESSKVEWPPNGRLSERMSDVRNSWKKIWNEALPLPASEQKPLLDPNREGEKVLHYLETLPPHQLLEQLICTAFRVAAGTLNQTSFGVSEQLTTKIGQLYATIGSMRKNMNASRIGSDSDVFEEVRRVCISFKHVEKLILLAASLHRRFSQSPRLAQTIFSDYYNYHLPRMGTASTSNESKKFDKKQRIMGRQERKRVAEMFSPPTANQSWRKVLNMGNLLNGHEPISREIIFSKCDDEMSGNNYGCYEDHPHPHPNPMGEIETHRMYVCSTSNDLRVALAVASYD